MPKKILLTITGVVVIVLAGLLIIGYNNSLKPETGVEEIILFYGNDCPHCKIVEDFINQNKIEDEVKFTRLEVFDNKVNSNLLAEKAQACRLDTNQIGVPFLWSGQSCFMGDVDVIKFFQDKISQKNQ
jgi:glutaredoxin